ncbi:hypothetical protein [Cupriavidus sp. D384]|uniref:hypothetical protein n=1 Tax=Cupriavidus sp. D384 TaxID=1538095 RepID=UPI000834E66A|nr:hypothetical protein [Cupriavidus sp. D384]
MKPVLVLTAALAMEWTLLGWAQAQPIRGKPATAPTKSTSAAALKEQSFSDKADFEDTQRALVAKPDKLTVRNAKGDVAWDIEADVAVRQRLPAAFNMVDASLIPAAIYSRLWL